MQMKYLQLINIKEIIHRAIMRLTCFEVRNTKNTNKLTVLKDTKKKNKIYHIKILNLTSTITRLYKIILTYNK